MTDLSISSIRHHPSYIACSPIEVQTSNYRIARWLSKGSSSDDVFFNGVNDVPYIIVANIWACGEAHSDFE